MKFEVTKPEKKKFQYPEKELDIAREFAKRVYAEFGTFIRAIVLFGSTTQMPASKKGDIDVLIILDDVRVMFSKELIQTYRIVLEKIIAEVDPERLHIQSMKFTSFWEYMRAGDPVAINILRYGLALVDTGFFDPLQALLDQGRIRPSEESIYTYFTMAPTSLHRANQHLLTAAVDLYWAAIDSAHAALMAIGEIPPTPEHVADMLERKVFIRGGVKGKYANIMRQLYSTYKKISHREVKDISGKEYDQLRKKTIMFVNEMKKYIERKK